MAKAKDNTTEAEAFFAEVERFCSDHKISQRTLSNRVANDTYKLERMRAQREKDIALMEKFRAEMARIGREKGVRGGTGQGALAGPA